MDKIAVFIDDAAYARSILQPLMGSATPTHCVLVACPPRLSRRIGKWVSHAQREQWRDKWADRLFREVVPLVRVVAGGKVERLKADQPLADFSAQLRSRLGSDLLLLDARRPKLGHPTEPVNVAQAGVEAGLASPIAVTSSLCAVLALVD